MNESYTGFAACYDAFMDNVPYDRWADFIVAYLHEKGIKEGLVADLGCGTGQLTRLLLEKGFDMIGIDSSEDMLQVARDYEALASGVEEMDAEDIEAEDIEAEDMEAEDMKPRVLYLCQDMREFELYGTVAAVVSVCDSLNYITDKEELTQAFGLVNNYLDEGGYFIFDLNTPYKYRELLADNCIAEQREDMAFIWDNYFDEESCINEYALTLFLKKENGDYERQDELHYERSYELSEIKEMLEDAGMEFVEAFCDYSKRVYLGNTECERMVIVAREAHQEGKFYGD